MKQSQRKASSRKNGSKTPCKSRKVPLLASRCATFVKGLFSLLPNCFFSLLRSKERRKGRAELERFTQRRFFQGSTRRKELIRREKDRGGLRVEIALRNRPLFALLQAFHRRR